MYSYRYEMFVLHTAALMYEYLHNIVTFGASHSVQSLSFRHLFRMCISLFPIIAEKISSCVVSIILSLLLLSAPSCIAAVVTPAEVLCNIIIIMIIR